MHWSTASPVSLCEKDAKGDAGNYGLETFTALLGKKGENNYLRPGANSLSWHWNSKTRQSQWQAGEHTASREPGCGY